MFYCQLFWTVLVSTALDIFNNCGLANTSLLCTVKWLKLTSLIFHYVHEHVCVCMFWDYLSTKVTNSSLKNTEIMPTWFAIKIQRTCPLDLLMAISTWRVAGGEGRGGGGVTLFMVCSLNYLLLQLWQLVYWFVNMEQTCLSHTECICTPIHVYLSVRVKIRHTICPLFLPTLYPTKTFHPNNFPVHVCIVCIYTHWTNNYHLSCQHKQL